MSITIRGLDFMQIEVRRNARPVDGAAILDIPDLRPVGGVDEVFIFKPLSRNTGDDCGP